MAQDIARKLRLTAAVLGVVTRKDLAAAFRRVNANTSFDIGRADKWLQGRARPRELQVYEDWSKVLELDRSGQWIADCEAEAFLDEICDRHGLERKALLQSVEASEQRNQGPGRAFQLAGTFACYSHAWSPYFCGRFIRGELSIDPVSSRSRLPATYTEMLPTGPIELKGTIAIGKRSTMHLEVSDTSGGVPVLTFSLFPASPPASILAGLMFGTTIIGPDVQPSVTRIVMVRLPASEQLRSAGAYLPPEGSIAEDLATLGLQLDKATAVDHHLSDFLSGGSGGFDQVPVSKYRALADIFDRAWLSATT